MQFASVVLAFPAVLLGNDVAQPAKEGPNNPAAIRKALDEKITLDFKGESLEDAVNHLSEKTKLKIIIESYKLQYGGMGYPAGPSGGLGAFGQPFGAGAFGGNPVPGTPGFPASDPAGVTMKINNGKVRTVLQDLISGSNRTIAIIGDTVLLAPEEVAQQRRLKQRIKVDTQGLSLADALKNLAEDYYVDIIIDPRQIEKAKTKTDLKLEEVSLETALRLLTEFADLDWVSVGNVVLITNVERAEKLRKDNAPSPPK